MFSFNKEKLEFENSEAPNFTDQKIPCPSFGDYSRDFGLITITVMTDTWPSRPIQYIPWFQKSKLLVFM